ncbi:nucleotidyltransferase [Candidatus Termititenax aidoneus]|uniref:Nucleotidyltransferase n=1 Tax=Termititenax aidoneus TaxID=2218524 RepID=A0A388TCR9_TERA1|nr:nucleotidyltransferase [Candidatus Termititenax aidoneus]
MPLDLTSLVQVIDALQKALSSCVKNEYNQTLTVEDKETLKAGVIQNFEIAYEVCWKFLKRWLELNITDVAIDGLPRRELFRKAQENSLIKDAAKWFEYHNARNETAHTYNSDKAAAVYSLTAEFLKDAQNLLKVLE